ncbi:MAG: phosphate acyltransferase PlsX [Clostridia bacterium]|nr:phosphate acyltransferase PlsX [Clostridia bacterium]MBQ8511736.1 phosphate acyltransferase PlsX [Clostridia bacterium]
MKIIIDAMGGDNAPGEIVKGAALASQKYQSDLVLVGDKAKIEGILKNETYNKAKIEIVHTDEVVTMEDDPLSVVRAKKNSSMGTGLQLLKADGDAFISAGNTGALHVGSSLIIRSLKGVQRAAIATIIPFRRPILMMDSGANVNVTADYLVQWAMMGSIYMKNVFGVDMPEVGLLNNGAEEHKGTQIQIDAYAKLKNGSGVKFIGNVEGKELPFDRCDVLVTDGFTGNVTLKLIEGMAKFMFSELKGMYTKNTATKMSYLIMKDQLKGLKNSFDASEYGGAPLLGLQKPVIKAHGSSDAKAIYNAVRQAEAFIDTGVIGKIGTAMIDYSKKQAEARAKEAADAKETDK